MQKLQTSSSWQYQSVRKIWLDYIHTKSPVKISMETLFSFLIYLFEDKHLAVTTVMAYKAGLTAPLFYRFGIDFIIEVVTSLLRSFALQRPAPERLPIT